MFASLARKSVVVVFALSPTGLGHLRVSDALYHGLPDSITPHLLGTQDKSISVIYRFMSIHPLLRFVMEFFQQGAAENMFTTLYRSYLRAHTNILYQQVVTILDERLDLPKTVILVATHTGLAHQLSAIKSRLVNEKKLQVFLFVQVTDDSPQLLWYVEGAEAIFVPSKKTKESLERYGKLSHFAPVPCIVTPYPVSPKLRGNLSPKEYIYRKQQLEAGREGYIHIAVPLSGAAVGMTFTTTCLQKLSSLSKRYYFHIIAKNAIYTRQFLTTLLPMRNVSLSVSDHDRGVVDLYEKVYLTQSIGLEITKPSEQAFKALLDPQNIGGSLLLFTHPVGRQEYDNLDFLRRHALLSTHDQQQLLLNYFLQNELLKESIRGQEILSAASHWRGIELPEDPAIAAEFIEYCLKQSLFHAMLSCRPAKENDPELGENGVEQFWHYVGEIIEEKKD